MSATTVTVGATIGATTNVQTPGAYDVEVDGFAGQLDISGTAAPGGTFDIVGVTGQPFGFNDFVSGGATEVFNPTGSNYAPLIAFDLGDDPNIGTPVGAGTLELGSNLVTAGVEIGITFGGTGNELILDPGVNASQILQVVGFGHTDTIALDGVTGIANAVWTQTSGTVGGTLSLDNASGTPVEQFAFATGSFTSAMFSATTAGGNTDVTVACYRAGTRIATSQGEVAVEALAIGDAVLTADGTAKPVKWLGRRSYSGRFAAGKRHLLPIRFEAGALGNGRPRRALWVSPQHAMLIDGTLIPAACLVNGISIVQEREVDRIDYIHVELERHDVLFAEGAASETYVDDDNRLMFHNAAEYRTLYGPARPAAAYCATRLEDGPTVEAIRRRLARLAGQRATGDDPGPLHGWFERIETKDGIRHAVGWAQDVAFPEAPVCLELVAGRRVLRRFLAHQHRPDVEDAGHGSGRHGFRIPLPADVGGPVIVRRAADGAVLTAAFAQAA